MCGVGGIGYIPLLKGTAGWFAGVADDGDSSISQCTVG